MKKYTVNDLESIQDEFYRLYNPHYWCYKISLLKNCHDNFDNVKETLTKDISEVIDQDYKRMIRTEMHFLYFQMIETLFELIFAVTSCDNRNLWVGLTFSKGKGNYYKIEQIASDRLQDPDLRSKAKTVIEGVEVEIPLLRWIFYFACSLNMTSEQWSTNLGNIEMLLREFARDFTDRDEYNAYKHSLRFHNTSFSLSIRESGSEASYSLGQSEDAISYLEEYKQKDKNGTLMGTGQLAKTTKPFDFEHDYRCCILIYEMITDIINTRKYALLKELHDQKFRSYSFYNFNVTDILTKSTSLGKSTFTC